MTTALGRWEVALEEYDPSVPLSPKWAKFKAQQERYRPTSVVGVCGIDVPFWNQ